MTAMTPDKVEAALGVLRRCDDALDLANIGSPSSAEITEALSVLTEALAERERDAARYRWLRDSAHPDAEASGAAVMEQRFSDWGKPYFHHFSGQSLDAAIDAAIKETP